MNTLRTLALMTTAFLLAFAGPLASATHTIPTAGFGPLPTATMPAFPAQPAPTRHEFVDRNVGAAYDTAVQTYTGPGGSVYQLFMGTTEMASTSLMDHVLPNQAISTYQDGAGEAPHPSTIPETEPSKYPVHAEEGGIDDRRGGFGPRQILGSAPWGRSGAAARNGAWGFSLAQDDGRYPPSATGMLLTPALDLLAGTSCFGTGIDGTNPPNITPPSVGGLNSPINPNCISPAGGQAPIFNFQARFNLGSAGGGAGRDGVVVMVFTAPPTQPPATYQQCTAAIGCFIATPVATTNLLVQALNCNNFQFQCPVNVVPPTTPTGYPGNALAFGGQPGFVGASDWTSYNINLRTAIGAVPPTAWIGFYFASAAFPTSNYFDGGFFSQSMGFYGFQLDDLQLSITTPPTNVRVRPLSAPAVTVAGQALPTLHPDVEIPVFTEVVNSGRSTVTIRAQTQVIDNVGGTVLRQEMSPVVEMPPQSFLKVFALFDPLPDGTQATARVSVASVPGAGTANSFVASLAQGGTPQWRNNPADDAASLPFQVATVRAVVPGQIERETGWVRLGEGIKFSLPFQNLGNVAEDIILEARVYDMASPDCIDGQQGCIVDLLPIEEVLQSFHLEPGGSASAAWTVQGTEAGQYRLFVRRVDDGLDAPFTPAIDLLSTLAPSNVPAPVVPLGMMRPMQIPYRNATPVLDGVLEAGVWTPQSTFTAQAMAKHQLFPFGLASGFNNFSPFNLWVFHDQQSLHVAINVPVSGAVNQPGGLNVTFWFDPDERHSNPVPVFVPRGAPNYRATVSGNFVNNVGIEISMPLQQVAPHGKLGMFILLNSGNWALSFNSGNFSFPAGAEYVDGGFSIANDSNNIIPASYGLRQPDGSLADEMDIWLRFNLDPVTPAPRLPFRVLGPGFGIDRSAPPLFFEDFQECPTERGWTQYNIVARLARAFTNSPHRRYPPGTYQTEKWSCGQLEPDGPRMLFEGLAQDANTVCGPSPCRPYSLSSANGLGFGTLDSPPIDIGSAAEPWLILRHQVSNDVTICDGPHLIDFADASGSSYHPLCATNAASNPTLGIWSYAEVQLRIWNPALQAFGPAQTVVLVPEEGYTTEDSIGIADFTRNLAAGRAALRAPGSQAQTRDPCGPNKGLCGMWDPSGWQYAYRPADQNTTVPTQLDGSPWRTDRFRLHGLQGYPGQQTALNLQGQTIQLRFVYDRARSLYLDPIHPETEPDFGWRIGAIAVTEEPEFMRDVSVEALRVDAGIFDPAEGVGPGVDLPVTVNLSNNGLLDARNVYVELQGIDVTSPPGMDPLLCSAEISVGGIIPYGGQKNVTLACSVPDRPGAQLNLRARVRSTEGDDFPRDNELRARESYVVRKIFDVAPRVSVSPRVASTDYVRNTNIVLENRGNQPLTDFEVTRTIFLRTGAGFGDALNEFTRKWHINGTLEVGAALPIEHPSLQANPPVVPSADLAFPPTQPGVFDLVVQIKLKDDSVPSNDIAKVAAEALSVLYSEKFDTPPVIDTRVVTGIRSQSGTPGVWVPGFENDVHGKRMVLGDPEQGDIPALTNGSLVLPEMDLTAMRAATLAFTHRYDLETGFDGARVEISTDNGTSWRALRPNRSPAMGVPDGYPSVELFGTSPFLEGAARAKAIAFTGRSEELTGAAPDGFINSEFNLANDPQLRRPSNLDVFEFQGFASRPSPIPLEQEGGRFLQFKDDSWALREPDAQVNQRYWWVENATAQEPRPHSGQSMWWSGTYGSGTVAQPATPVCNVLSRPVPLANAPPREGERLLLSWWDWRAGWHETDNRSGTGARFLVDVASKDSDGDGLPDYIERRILTKPNVTDTDADGWSDGMEYYFQPRATSALLNPLTPNSNHAPTSNNDGISATWAANVGLTPVNNGANLDPDADGLSNLVEQNRGSHPLQLDTDNDGLNDGTEVLLYGTDPTKTDPVEAIEQRSDGWTLRQVDLTPYRHENVNVSFIYLSAPSANFPFPLTQVNLGWFLDDLQVDSWLAKPGGNPFSPLPVLALQDMEGLVLDPTTLNAGAWGTNVANPTSCGPTTWQPVGRGAAARDGGWHIAGLQVPGKGTTEVWLFAADNEQGYPHLADSRLVTPPVDLGQAQGDKASLRFMHKFDFESFTKTPRTQAHPADPNRGSFISALDGGVVEYQVYDEGTGTYGEWRQLFRGFRDHPELLRLDAMVPDNANARLIVDRLTDDGLWNPGPKSNLNVFARTGYNAINERGQVLSVIGPGPQVNPVDIGQGYSFERFNGVARFAGVQLPGSTSFSESPWLEYPISYVFSGTSNGPQGWREEEWDISPLMGQRVRFGFHSHSNPLYLDPENKGPLFGWAISELAVTSEIFQGQPVQLRLRATTDGTLLKGSWEVDDLQVVGESFTRNLGLVVEEPEILALPGADVEVKATLVNLGNQPRGGLALSVQVIEAKTQIPSPGFKVLEPSETEPGAILDPSGVVSPPEGGRTLRIPGSLSANGLPGSSIPITIRIPLPANASSDWVVKARVLENRGSQGELRYDTPENQISGATRASWKVQGTAIQKLALRPSLSDHSIPIGMMPAAPSAGQSVTFNTTVANHGTTMPELQLQWRLEEILRKGSGAPRQPHTAEVKGWSLTVTQTLGALAPHQVKSTAQALQLPPQEGLFRITAVVLADGQQAAVAQREFLAGLSGVYYEVDFSKTPASQSGWVDASPPQVPNSGGGTPPEQQWRDAGGQFVWGVTGTTRLGGTTYCGTPNAICNVVLQGSGSPSIPPPYNGMQGLGVGPFIDLTRVPQGQAKMVVEQGHDFDLDDGGFLEALPLRTPVDSRRGPEPVFLCNGNPDWFRPKVTTPLGGVAKSLPGRIVGVGRTFFGVPNLINSLAPVPGNHTAVVGGPPVANERMEMDLGTPARSECSGGQVMLTNYTVQFRFHAGTRPGVLPQLPSIGPRTGATGWQIDGLRVSSTDFSVNPTKWAVPIQDGARKEFRVQVTNLGQVADAFHIGLDADASTLPNPEWVILPQQPLALGPGQTGSATLRVDIPSSPDLSRGGYTVALTVASERDPGLIRTSELRLVMNPNPLPDLVAQLAVEAEGPLPSFEVGTVAPVHITVYNLGQSTSRSVSLRMRASPSDGGQVQDLGNMEVPSLCPVVSCGKAGSSRTLTVEWFVPEQTGVYQLEAHVDPVGRVVDEDLANNQVAFPVRVIPLQRPDVRMASLEITGIGFGGYVEEGSLVRITANVTNVGNAPATGVQVRILSGSSELSQSHIETLPPGQQRSLTAFKTVSAGESVISALAHAPGNLELRVDNNDLSRILRVRGHDFVVRADASPFPIPQGGTFSMPVAVLNRGNAVERLNLSLEGATGWGLETQPRTATVAPNGTATLVAVVRAPDNATAGEVPLRLVARAVTNYNVQANTTLLAVIPREGEAPLLRAHNATALPGPVRVGFALQSRSNTHEGVVVTLAAPAWEAVELPIWLPARGHAYGNLSVELPGATPPGTHGIEVVARDIAGLAVAQARATMEVLEHPEATASWRRATLDAQDVLGPRVISLGLEVRNAGNVPVWIRAVPRDLPPGHQLANLAAPTLVPVAGALELNITVNVAPDAPSRTGGQVQVWMRPEKSDTETLATSLPIPDPGLYPNLFLKRIEALPRGELRTGQSFRILVEVENRGGVASPGTLLSAYVNGALVQDVPLAGLAPGETQSLELPWRAAIPGEQLVAVFADGARGVAEGREDDNGASLLLNVAEPNLAERVRAAPASPWAVFLALAVGLCIARSARRRRQQP